MNAMVGLLLIVLAAVAGVLLMFGLERWLRQPGLAFVLAGCAMLVGAGLGFANGQRLIPILFLIQAPGFFYSAHWRRTAARAVNVAATEA